MDRDCVHSRSPCELLKLGNQCENGLYQTIAWVLCSTSSNTSAKYLTTTLKYLNHKYPYYQYCVPINGAHCHYCFPYIKGIILVFVWPLQLIFRTSTSPLCKGNTLTTCTDKTGAQGEQDRNRDVTRWWNGERMERGESDSHGNCNKRQKHFGAYYFIWLGVLFACKVSKLLQHRVTVSV